MPHSTCRIGFGKLRPIGFRDGAWRSPSTKAGRVQGLPSLLKPTTHTLVVFGFQNRAFGPYSVRDNRILDSVMVHRDPGPDTRAAEPLPLARRLRPLRGAEWRLGARQCPQTCDRCCQSSVRTSPRQSASSSTTASKASSLATVASPTPAPSGCAAVLRGGLPREGRKRPVR
jgi:hypothetical protein